MAFIDTSTSHKMNSSARRVTNELHRAIMTKDKNTAKKLLFWLNTWSNNYLLNEQSFNYNELIAYKRGMVVKADFGFNVGSEQGGLHYALVIENNNDKSNKTVMVIPLGSLPDNKAPEDIIEKNEVFLGYSLFDEEINNTKEEIEKKKQLIVQLSKIGEDTTGISKSLSKLSKKLSNYQKGTIALLNQVCALSKIRIHTPKNSSDELFSFQLSHDKLELIDEKLTSLYLTEKNSNKKLTSD